MKLKSIFIMVSLLAFTGIVFLFLNQPKDDQTPVEYTPFIWDFDMDALTNIEVVLPKQDLKQSWVLHEDRYFYFDEEGGTKVDMVRWGGGIPLILSGPQAARVIYEFVPDDQLGNFGFDEPNMYINLKLNDGATFQVVMGDPTPGGGDYYIKMAESNTIFTVFGGWYEVIAGLVTNPPYQPAVYEIQEITIVPSQPAANQPFTIRATIANTGVLEEPAGSMVLKFQGKDIATWEGTFPGGTITTIEFPIEGQPSGTYSINLGGKHLSPPLVIP